MFHSVKKNKQTAALFNGGCILLALRSFPIGLYVKFALMFEKKKGPSVKAA